MALVDVNEDDRRQCSERIPGVREMERMARRAEAKFVAKHGMSSADHMETVINGNNDYYDDCDCYTCSKKRYVIELEQKRKEASPKVSQAAFNRLLKSIKRYGESVV